MDAKTERKDGTAVVLLLAIIMILGLVGYVVGLTRDEEVVFGTTIFEPVTTTPSDYIIPPPGYPGEDGSF